MFWCARDFKKGESEVGPLHRGASQNLTQSQISLFGQINSTLKSLAIAKIAGHVKAVSITKYLGPIQNNILK